METVESRCKQTVYPNDQWGAFHPHQCTRKVWKDGFCMIHHPDTVKERNEKSKQRWEEKRKKDPLHRLFIALDRIKELEAEVERLKSQVETLTPK